MQELACRSHLMVKIEKIINIAMKTKVITRQSNTIGFNKETNQRIIIHT